MDFQDVSANLERDTRFRDAVDLRVEQIRRGMQGEN